MGIKLITCTGGRPEAFALCTRWVARMVNGLAEVTWIVVDDVGDVQAPVIDGLDVILVKPTPRWKPGQPGNTLARNILAALAHVSESDSVFFVEDDDYYASDYLRHMLPLLRKCSLVGETESVYVNVASRRVLRCSNRSHASLCSTALRGATVLSLLEYICLQDPKFIDLELWRLFRSPKQLVRGGRVTGIKGLPGRGGIGCGHRDNIGARDPELSVLRDRVGFDDWQLYALNTWADK